MKLRCRNDMSYVREVSPNLPQPLKGSARCQCDHRLLIESAVCSQGIVRSGRHRIEKESSCTQFGFLKSVFSSAALNRACKAIPTKVAIRIAG